MDLERLEHDVKRSMIDHFDECLREEERLAGEVSDYRLTTEIDENSLFVTVLTIPTRFAKDEYGETRMGKRIRFWRRTFQYEYVSEIDVLVFRRQNENSWTIDAATIFRECGELWMPRRINSIARHSTGRYPFESASFRGSARTDREANERALPLLYCYENGTLPERLRLPTPSS